LPIEDDALFAL